MLALYSDSVVSYGMTLADYKMAWANNEQCGPPTNDWLVVKIIVGLKNVGNAGVLLHMSNSLGINHT